MQNVNVLIEITNIHNGVCEVMVTGTEPSGQVTCIDAVQAEWPMYARTWRPMLDAVRRWLVEVTDPAG